jgi:predicted alpha/beta hydrolase family esterase
MVHGWDGNPRNYWFPAVKKALEAKGFKVAAVRLPDPATPKIKPWVSALKAAVGTVDEETYFIGHSCGCQVIIRYLGSQKNKCGGAVFVAGWFLLTPESTPDAESRRLAKPWLLSPILFEKVKAAMKASAAILSDGDPYVPLAPNAEVFEKTLSASVIIQKGKGHFEGKEYPIIAKTFTKLAK